jgi:hypothetical protein
VDATRITATGIADHYPLGAPKTASNGTVGSHAISSGGNQDGERFIKAQTVPHTGIENIGYRDARAFRFSTFDQWH